MTKEELIKLALRRAIDSTQQSIDLYRLTKAIESKDVLAASRELGINGSVYLALTLALETYLAPLLIQTYDDSAALSDDIPLSATQLTHQRELTSDVIAAFVTDSIKALLYGLQAGLQSLPANVLATQLKLSVGLTEAQARSLSSLSTALQQLNTQPAAVARLTIGNKTTTYSLSSIPLKDVRFLNAAQRSALTKAMNDGLTEEAAERFMERQTAILKDARLKAIAATTQTKIENSAKQGAVEQAIKDGKETSVRRFWITRHDEKVRHDHSMVEVIHSQGVAIDQPFQTPLGPCMYPPLEVYCRCRVEYRRKDGTKI